MDPVNPQNQPITETPIQPAEPLPQPEKPLETPAAPQAPPENKSKKKLFIIAGIVVAIFILTAIAVFAYMQMQGPEQAMGDEMPARPELTPTADVGGSDWETYEGNQISFKYPKGFYIDETQVGEAAVIFVDITPILIPSAWDGNLTPFEVKVTPNSTIEQHESTIKNLVTAQSLKQTSFSGNGLIGNIFEGEGSGIHIGKTIRAAVLSAEGNVYRIDFYETNDFTPDLFNQILSTLRFDSGL
jgi:hypothetical protein